MQMKWRLIDKSASTQPSTGGYSDWKSLLSNEANAQCVYCCIHESRFGGIRNFHVEHYRPQSKFPELEDAYGNLFYSCGICNVFKSDDWPGEHAENDYSHPVYPDPSVVDYCSFLDVEKYSGMVVSNNVTGKYVIERLYLNRPHIVGLRVLSDLMEKIHKIHDDLEFLHNERKIPLENQVEVIDSLFSLRSLLKKYIEARPYTPDQIKRPHKSKARE